MLRIRQVYSDALPRDRDALAQVQTILRIQLSGVPEREIAGIADRVRSPMKYPFRTVLFVAEDWKGVVKGFALISHGPRLNFCYLDYLSAAKGMTGGGTGGALYERVREEALRLDALGLFFECLPDDPHLCDNPELLRQNIARLRFYERFGATPIVNTAYETPVEPGSGCPPYLMFDGLGRNADLGMETARAIVRMILERQLRNRSAQSYIEMVVGSFKDDPVQLREPRYFRGQPRPPTAVPIPPDRRITLVVTDQHAIHHVRDRGYVEAPVRISSILAQLERTNLFESIPARHFSERHIKAVHDPRFVEYLETVCSGLESGKSIYPYVFPIRNAARPPKELAVRAGYYCIDTFTPLNRNAYLAAKRAVDCALTAAQALLDGHRLAYALVRPPGHHAERQSFGGFCYFNSTAVAAHYLSAYGKVAVLDIDYHHGNGQQDIFYGRPDVMTISIHGHPSIAYPYFSGFADETGVGAGAGYNLNLPLPESLDGEHYREALSRALRRLVRFQPHFLIVALGLDTGKGDPTGSWSLQPKDFEANGKMIGALQLPTLVVQEGGYYNRVLGINARQFFEGLWTATYRSDGGFNAMTAVARQRQRARPD